jgi:hypothetical protein
MFGSLYSNVLSQLFLTAIVKVTKSHQNLLPTQSVIVVHTVENVMKNVCYLHHNDFLIFEQGLYHFRQNSSI